MQPITYTYVTYINTTAELWNALIDPEITRKYWFNNQNTSDWQEGSPWEHRAYDDSNDVRVRGKVLESKPVSRLVLTWAQPENNGIPEKTSRVTFEIEPVANSVKLSVLHEELDAEMAEMVTGGWPMVLSGLKTLLETGAPLDFANAGKCGKSNESLATH